MTRPLRSLRHLRLNGFGADYMPFNYLSKMFLAFSESPLESIAMTNIRSVFNNDQWLNFDLLFPVISPTLRNLSISCSYLAMVTGQLSKSLPYLRALSLSISSRVAGEFLYDLLSMTALEEQHLYAYPDNSVIDVNMEHLVTLPRDIGELCYIDTMSRNCCNSCVFAPPEKVNHTVYE